MLLLSKNKIIPIYIGAFFKNTLIYIGVKIETIHIYICTLSGKIASGTKMIANIKSFIETSKTIFAISGIMIEMSIIFIERRPGRIETKLGRIANKMTLIDTLPNLITYKSIN
jgi:hypothetical protein